jgi:hypothetical protein
MLWDQKRRTKIAMMRESFELAKLEDCSFKPANHNRRKSGILSARSKKTQ